MRRLVDINILDDEGLQARVVWVSLVICVLGTLVGVFLALIFPHEPISWKWFLALGAVSVVALPVHELLHALGFLVCTGFSARLRFGFASGMLYTASPGTTLRRNTFCAVLLAPAVLLTATLYLTSLLFGYPLLGWFLAVVHLAGCSGDFGYVHIIMSEPKATLVQDTERGIALFHDDRD